MVFIVSSLLSPGLRPTVKDNRAIQIRSREVDEFQEILSPQFNDFIR